MTSQKTFLHGYFKQGFFLPFGEIFDTDEIGKKLCDFGKKYEFWKKLVQFLANSGKFTWQGFFLQF